MEVTGIKEMQKDTIIPACEDWKRFVATQDIKVLEENLEIFKVYRGVFVDETVEALMGQVINLLGTYITDLQRLTKKFEHIKNGGTLNWFEANTSTGI